MIDPNTAVISAIERLERIGRGGPEDWATKPDAEPDSYEWHLHRARLELDTYRGTSTEGPPRVVFESAAELLKRDLKKTPWLVQGLLPEDGVIVLAGEPKAHKTFAALDLAIAAANGTRAFGEFPTGEARPVALFLAEDSPRSVRGRLAALARGAQLEPAAALARVFVQCRASLNLQDDRDLCTLIAGARMISGGPPALIVLDPLRDLHRGEENDSGAMSEVMGNLRALRSIIGCSVLFVHHLAKSSKETSGRRPGQRMRGSGAIHGSVDGGFYFAPKDSQGGQIFTNTAEVELKAVRGAAPFTLTLRLDDDQWGEVQKATWTYAKDETVRAPGDAIEHLIFILAADHARTGRSATFSQEQLRSRMHRKTEIVRDAIFEAERRGLVRPVMQGKRPLGFEYVPPPQPEGASAHARAVP